MIVVLYTPAPDHPDGGPITCQVKGSEARIRALSEPYVEVFEDRNDWDSTHFVLEGQVVPIPAEIIAARELAMARVRLRVQRDGLLRDVADPILGNRARWDELTPEQQAAWTAYREALLDWPETEADPLNPTPPPVPE